jgi:ferredoxin-NADP reductase
MKAVFTAQEEVTKTGIKSFYFELDPKPSFIAGQFTELTLPNGLKHWFTISSAPKDKQLRITTRLTGSDYKNALDSLRPGDEVDLAEPMGDFVLPLDSSIPILMVAGGIGVTPFLSILEDEHSKGTPRNLNLIYASKNESDFVDLSSYKDMLTTYNKVVGTLSTLDILNEGSKLATPYIYVSGPEGLVEKITNEIKEHGFPENQLVADYFPGY